MLGSMKRSLPEFGNHRRKIYETFLRSQVKHSESTETRKAKFVGNRQCCSIIDQNAIGLISIAKAIASNSPSPRC